MSDGKKYFIAWIAVLLLPLIPIAYGLFKTFRGDTTPAIERDTVTIVIRDTLTVVKPQPIVISSAGLQRVTLPLWREDSQTISKSDSVFADSAEVALPIERRVYADSTYRAIVSGAFVSLDSITVYPRREIQRITIRQRPRRWGLGVSVGYGVTPHGITPYLGVGVSYTLIGW